MSSSSTSAFARLRDRRPPAQRERMTKLRDELALADHDALWSLLELVENHCTSTPLAPISQEGEQPTSSSPKSPWRMLALGMGAQVLLLAAAMYVGGRAAATGGAIAWPSCEQAAAPQSVLATVLNAPAGWMVFILCLLPLAHLARLGWRLRASEPLVGWIIAATSTLTATALLGLLLWLI